MGYLAVLIDKIKRRMVGGVLNMEYDKLTTKQKAFIDYYKQGYNATESARLAGYKASNEHSLGNIGSENLEKLGEFIKANEDEIKSTRIATIEEVNEFWTKIIKDENEKTSDRLKASELRARCAGAFIENVNLNGAPAVVILNGESDLED
jgi:hypothetical protein